MSKDYNDNNIIVHNFTQKLKRYKNNGIYPLYHQEKSNSSIIRYINNNKNTENNNKNFNFNSKNSLYDLSDKNLYITKQKISNSKQTQKYLYPSLNNNLLCENLFQRNSQILPKIPKLIKKNKDKKFYIFLSTSSFEFKKRDISTKCINSLKKTDFFFKNNKIRQLGGGKASSTTPTPLKEKFKIFNKNIKTMHFKSPKNEQKRELSREIKLLSDNNNTNNNNNSNENVFYYIIRPENCGYIVKNCFKHRKNWKELTNLDNKNFNFKWQQNNYGIDFNKLSTSPNIKQMINHFEYKSVISNKANMFLNMMEFSELQEINIFKYLPFTVLFDYNKANFFNKIIKFEYLFKNITNFLVPIYDINERKYKKNKERLYSHFFPFTNKVGSKTAINIPETHYFTKKIKTEIISNDNDSFNETRISTASKAKNNYWLIKAPDLNRGRGIKILNNMSDIKRTIREFSMGIKLGYINEEILNEDNNYNYYMNYDEDINDINFNNFHSNSNTNSLYDFTNSINLINLNYSLKNNNKTKTKQKSKEKENDLISNNSYNTKYTKYNKDTSKYNNSIYNNSTSINFNNNKSDSDYRSNMIILQKYIENPLLYFGRKFDIRIWVLLTHDLKIYVFEEGHLKCCSINYDLNSDNNFCHLTNYSFQKYNSNFGKYESGNEASFNDLQKNIEINYNSSKNFKQDIFPKIIDIIKLSFESVKYKINPLNRNYTFEIFGFDFMLDYEFNPFLIEINTNPGLEESSPLIKMLVPRMIDDALRLTVDKIFETEYDFGEKYKYSTSYESPFRVDGYRNSDNLFKFVCDLYQDSNCDVYRNYYLSNNFNYNNNGNNSKQFFFRNNNNKI